MTPDVVSQQLRSLPERLNDAVWGWAVDRVRRKHDAYWWLGRTTYLIGRVIDR